MRLTLGTPGITLATTLSALGLSGCVVDTTYLGCVDDFDCSAGPPSELCLDLDTTFANGSFCTYGCFDDVDCEDNRGFRGRCIQPPGAPDLLPVCFQSCLSDVDCFATSVCAPLPDRRTGDVLSVCVPNNQASLSTLYTACAETAQCDVPEACFEIETDFSVGRFCSLDCVDDFDCPSTTDLGAFCIRAAGDINPDICYQRCFDDLDCFSSSICVDLIDDEHGAMLPVCVPDTL
ncbi:MAG: hypothetical protein ACFCGT_18725 [Sandaracinaceae bacterium]